MHKIYSLILCLFIYGIALSQTFIDGGSRYEVNPDKSTVTLINSGIITGSDFTIPNVASDGTTTYDVTIVGEAAFLSGNLTSVTIGNNVTTIESRAFSNNILTSIIIPDSVTTIGAGAFSKNELTDITIGNSLTFIEHEVFGFKEGVYKAGEINLSFSGFNGPKLEDPLLSELRYDYSFDYAPIITLTVPCLEAYANNPDYQYFYSIQDQGGNSFEEGGLIYCQNINDLTAAVIGKSIDNTTTDVIIPNSINYEGNTFTVISTTNNAFKGNQLTSVIIPNSITIIGAGTFQDNQLTSVVIPDNVTSIGDSAFQNNQLTSVIIPDNVTIIGDSAFQNNQLTSVIIPDNITIIGDSAFQNNQLTSVIIPDNVTRIGDDAFLDNQLTSVIIPDNATRIGSSAFQNNQLTSVIIPDNVTSIASNAFQNNQLTSVIIPDNVTHIGDSAFQNNQLTSVIIPDNITIIGDSAFQNNQLTSVIIPDNVRVILPEAFKSNLLTSVTIGHKTSEVRDRAFGFAPPAVSGQGEHNLVFLGPTPPDITINSFIDTSDTPNRNNITVTVGSNVLSTYKNNEQYIGFFDIIDGNFLNTQENSLENNLSLYPNPAQGQIQLSYAGSQALNNLVITDLLGKRVQEVALNEFTGTQTIDVSRLQTGLYFFTLASDQSTTTMRVVIK